MGQYQNEAFEVLLRKHAKFDVDAAPIDADPMGWGDREKEKIVFLDIDDVMIGSKQWAEACTGLSFNPFDPERSMRPARHAAKLDADAVEQLKRILRETGARIVIHSDWAIHLEGADLVWQKLLNCGLSADDFHPEWCLDLMRERLIVQHGLDVPRLLLGLKGGRYPRSRRIASWLSWHRPTSIAILDDSPVMTWIPNGAKRPDRPRLEPAPYGHPACSLSEYWVRIGDGKTRDVLSAGEAAKAIFLLEKHEEYKEMTEQDIALLEKQCEEVTEQAVAHA